jgi:hypothetical protein
MKCLIHMVVHDVYYNGNFNLVIALLYGPFPSLPSTRTLFIDCSLSINQQHLGRHIHGVDPLQSGERANLIVWYRQRIATVASSPAAPVIGHEAKA